MRLPTIKTFLRNLGHLHERLIARFLRKRGWVVFYLDEQARSCNGISAETFEAKDKVTEQIMNGTGECWLKLYENERIMGRV